MSLSSCDYSSVGDSSVNRPSYWSGMYTAAKQIHILQSLKSSVTIYRKITKAEMEHQPTALNNKP